MKKKNIEPQNDKNNTLGTIAPLSKKSIINLLPEDVVSLLPGNIFWKDISGKFCGCNNTVARIFKLKKPSDIIGKTNYDLFNKEMADKAAAVDDIVFTQQKEVTLEENGLDENGNIVLYLTTKSPLYNKQEQLVGLLGISIDITDRKKAEEYRIKSEAAQKVITFTNLIATSMAHEFRTPLQGIGCQTEAIEGTLNSKNLTPQQKDNGLREIARIIKGVVNAASNTVNEMLLKIRSFASGKLPQQGFAENSIATDIEDFLGTYPFESDQENLVRVSYGTKFKYIGDKTLTHHLLNSLLKNALTAVKNSDREKCEITIETKTKGNSNLLIFKDNTTGIPEDFIDKVFDQFETINTTDGGSGLGLSFCKMVMESYSGSIVCNSKEGKYTEFVLSFPKL